MKFTVIKNTNRAVLLILVVKQATSCWDQIQLNVLKAALGANCKENVQVSIAQY